MKTPNIKAFLLIIITIVFSSCVKSEFDKSSSPTLIKCKLSNSIGTKTEHDFDGNYLNIRWKRGDLITITNGDHWYKFELTGDISSDGKEAVFSHYGSNNCVKFPPSQTIAVYPYTGGAQTKVYGWSSKIATTEGLSQYDILLGKAVTSGNNVGTVEFSPLCAILRLPKGTKIAKNEQYTGNIHLLLSGENVCNGLKVSLSGNLELNAGHIQGVVFVQNGALDQDYYYVFIPKQKTGTFSYQISHGEAAAGGGAWSFSITDISTTCIYSLKKVFE